MGMNYRTPTLLAILWLVLWVAVMYDVVKLAGPMLAYTPG